MANNIETIEAKININAELAKKDINNLSKKLNILRGLLSDVYKGKMPKNPLLNISKGMLVDDAVNMYQEEILKNNGAILKLQDYLKGATSENKNFSSSFDNIKNKIKLLALPLEKIKEKISKIGKSIVKIAGKMLIRKALNAILNKIKEVLDYFALLDNDSGGKYGFNKTLSDGATNLTKLAAILSSVGTFLKGIIQPILNAITGVVVKLYNWIAKIINKISIRKLMILDENYWQNYADSISKASKSTKQLLSGFDELNMLGKKEENVLEGLVDEKATEETVNNIKQIPLVIKEVKGELGEIVNDKTWQEVFQETPFAEVEAAIKEDIKNATPDENFWTKGSLRNQINIEEDSLVGKLISFIRGDNKGLNENNQVIVTVDGNIIYETQQDYANKRHNITGR